MYETRHTFASWTLAAGETPEWVARILGHVDTSMPYRTYGRYIPNFARKDGSALEQQFENNANTPKIVTKIATIGEIGGFEDFN